MMGMTGSPADSGASPIAEAFNRIALDPARSVVIEACAGSGKTWLLVSRVVRLLLAGVAPSEILAITYTRKAAQEMQARLREWLEFLALAPEDEVRAFLLERAVETGDLDRVMLRARGLFESVLAARPGITINTFHGWFLQLLQRAPLDSAAAGGATLLDATSILLEEAWQSFADGLQRASDGPVAQALNSLFAEYGPYATRTLLFNFVHKRAEWWAYTRGRPDPLAYALDRLRQDLDADPARDIIAECLAAPGLFADLQEYAALLGRNTDKDRALADRLAMALARTEDMGALFAAACAVVLTREGVPRKRSASKAQVGRLTETGEARLLALHHALGEALVAAVGQLEDQEAYRFNVAALTCGVALLDRYQTLKVERGAMDFTDVEWRVYELLKHGEHAQYMQYKLDSRYRQVLLDEFQDTNPLQWQVLLAWLEASAEAGLQPAVFLVGDPKQSIYRFRRAEARIFAMAAEFLAERFGAYRLYQNTSRRNSPAVIRAVNAVFGPEQAFEGFQPHSAYHETLPGRVDVLPLAGGKKEDSGAAEPGHGSLRHPLTTARQAPEDRRREEEGRQLADRLLEMVGCWPVAEGGMVRPAQWRDVMLLVRSRTHLPIYERALKTARIPFVSARQGGLLDTMEAGDITALLEFLITPFADLHLARVLRSPLFGCGDEDLMALAQASGGTWWQRLAGLVGAGGASRALVRAQDLLSRWQAHTDKLPVHDLLDRIYFESDAIARYLQAVPDAMGAAVEANLQAFMDLALRVEGGRYPSLPKFIQELATLRRASAQEAPDEGIVGDVGDAVRILTVHGSKGLEAPIVWLLNASSVDARSDGYGVLLDWQPGEETPRHFSLYASARGVGPCRAHLLQAEAEFAAREDLNLLYVAMTRAKQVLIVSGSDSARSADSWHGKLSSVALPLPDWDEVAPSHASPAPRPGPVRAAADPVLTRPLPTGSREETGLSAARRYGINLHAVLEQIAPPRAMPEPEALRARLRLARDEFDALLEEALSIVNAPGLQPFFDPNCYRRAYNELPYVAGNGDIRRIDRLVEFADEVWVLDYKTRETPDSNDLQTAAAPYRAQLEEYRRAMADIYPGHAIRCAVVFQGGLLHEFKAPAAP